MRSLALLSTYYAVFCPPGCTACPSPTMLHPRLPLCDPRAFSLDEKVWFTLTVSVDSLCEAPGKKAGEYDMKWERESERNSRTGFSISHGSLRRLIGTSWSPGIKIYCPDSLFQLSLGFWERQGKWFQHMEWFIGPRHAWNRTGKEPSTADKCFKVEDLDEDAVLRCIWQT